MNLGISLRVAMFKRQKFLDTQRFLNDITTKSNESMPVDSLNLQITGAYIHVAYTRSLSNIFNYRIFLVLFQTFWIS